MTRTAPSGTTNYTHDANNRLTSAGGVNYSYDANGNLTGTSAGQSFAWDVFNRMTSASGPGGTATYTYNGDGLKIRRIGPDGTTRYYYDGIRPIWEADGAGGMKAQLDRDIFGNLLSRKEPSGTRRDYHFDGLGSTTALSDEGGAAVATLLYDAWGNQRAASGAPAPNYRFTGAELDTATGFYHMGARFYDPTIGRWLSEDPVQDRFFEPESLNFYVYAYDSAPNFLDADGKFAWWAVGGVIGLGFGLGAYLGSHPTGRTLSGALIWSVAGALVGMGLGAAAQALMNATAAGTATISAVDSTGVVRTMNAQLATKLQGAWTSAENFVAHAGHHAVAMGRAFGLSRGFAPQEYSALSQQAYDLVGGKVGTHFLDLTYQGVTHRVMIVINALGKIVTFRPD